MNSLELQALWEELHLLAQPYARLCVSEADASMKAGGDGPNGAFFELTWLAVTVRAERLEEGVSMRVQDGEDSLEITFTTLDAVSFCVDGRLDPAVQISVREESRIMGFSTYLGLQQEAGRALPMKARDFWRALLFWLQSLPDAAES